MQFHEVWMVSMATNSEGKMKDKRFYIRPKEYSHDKTPNNRRGCFFYMIPRDEIYQVKWAFLILLLHETLKELHFLTIYSHSKFIMPYLRDTLPLSVSWRKKKINITKAGTWRWSSHTSLSSACSNYTVTKRHER